MIPGPPPPVGVDLNSEPGWCSRCGASRQVTWCGVWAEYLCPSHQHERTYKELDATERPANWLAAQARDVMVVAL